jgi:hypothetical protein
MNALHNFCHFFLVEFDLDEDREINRVKYFIQSRFLVSLYEIFSSLLLENI